MSEREPPIAIDFDTFLRIVETSFKDFDMFSLLHTISEIAKHFGYYVWARTRDIILAYYETSARYKEPPHSVYITIVLKTGVALKIVIDREKDSNKIAMLRAWVVSVE